MATPTHAPAAPAAQDGVAEIPMTTVRAFGAAACAGGGWFRLLPYGLTRSGLRRVNATEGQPVSSTSIREIDPGQPRAEGAGGSHVPPLCRAADMEGVGGAPARLSLGPNGRGIRRAIGVPPSRGA